LACLVSLPILGYQIINFRVKWQHDDGKPDVILLNTSTQVCNLLHPHQFLESVAIGCMGKKWLTIHDCPKPSTMQSLENRVATVRKMKSLLLTYLTDNVEDRAGLRILLEGNDSILLQLHTRDLYPKHLEQSVSTTYFKRIALPLLVKWLAQRSNNRKDGLLYHLHEMMQSSSKPYPKNIQSYARGCIKVWQKEAQCKVRPLSWVRDIRENNYPRITSYKLSIDEWGSHQCLDDVKLNEIKAKITDLYMGGLLFSVLRKICGSFNDYSFYMSQKVLINNDISTDTTCHHNYYKVLAKAINHQDPASFLAEKRERFGRKKATRKLIAYRDYLFMPYVLQEQFKSDLVTPKRVIRLRNLYKELGANVDQTSVYLDVLDRQGYVLRALFSSLLYFKKLPWIRFETYASALKCLESEIEKNSTYENTELEIIKTLTVFLKELSSRCHVGESFNTLAVFLYCFRFNETNTQPAAQDSTKLLFWNTFGKKYDGQRYEYMLIATFNEFITNHAEGDQDLLCNPLLRLDQALERFFALNKPNNITMAVNQAFRKNSTIFRLESKSPYQALKDVEQDLHRLKMMPYLDNLLPSIKKFCSLSEHKKHKILAVLNKKQYERDYLTA
jgi:hypothetical protein